MADKNKEKFIRTHVDGINGFRDSLNKQDNNGNNKRKR